MTNHITLIFLVCPLETVDTVVTARMKPFDPPNLTFLTLC